MKTVFVYRNSLKNLNSTKRGAFFRHFCVSKVITTAHAHKSGVIFHIFSTPFKQEDSFLSFSILRPLPFRTAENTSSFRRNTDKYEHLATLKGTHKHPSHVDLTSLGKRKLVLNKKLHLTSNKETHVISVSTSTDLWQSCTASHKTSVLLIRPHSPTLPRSFLAKTRIRIRSSHNVHDALAPSCRKINLPCCLVREDDVRTKELFRSSNGGERGQCAFAREG